MKRHKAHKLGSLVVLGLVLAGFLEYSVSYAQQQQQGGQQQQGQPGKIDYGQIPEESVQNTAKKSYEETLYKITLDNFEEGGRWSINMPGDYGFARIMPRDGVPQGLKAEDNAQGQQAGQQPAPAPAAQDPNQQPQQGQPAAGTYGQEAGPDNKARMLGARINFFGGRRMSWARIDHIYPINLSGLVKGFEVWVAGRNAHHRLYIIVEDVNGTERLIDVGTLNFLGWRKLTAQIPFYIEQEDPYKGKRGLIFKGFLVNFDLATAYGDYYLYFDNLSAEISRFVEENQLKDNPSDNW